MESDRRTLIGLGGAATLVGFVPRARAASVPDFSNPVENIHALTRLESGAPGQPGIIWTSGKLVVFTPGTMARTICDYERCQMRVFRSSRDGSVEIRKHNWILRKDSATGKYLDDGYYRSLNVGMTYTPDGLSWWPDIKTDPKLVLSPFVLPWVVSGDVMWVTLHMAFLTPGVTGELEQETQTNVLQCRVEDMTNPALTTVPCTIDELLVVPDVPHGKGFRQFKGHGRKYAKASDLPAAFRDESERRFPGILGGPT